jgi:hypothetical protein
MLTLVNGSNFRLTTSVSQGTTVKVTLGGKDCADVKVWSTSLISFLTPVKPAGLAQLVIQNLNDAGAPIGGESVTVNNAYTFVAPSSTTQSDFTRLVRQVLIELGVQIFGVEESPNIVSTVHTDYSDTPNPTNIAYLSVLPSIVVTGPDINENRFDSEHVGEVVDVGGGVYEVRYIPYTCDLVFAIQGITDNGKAEQLNLKALVVNFFHKNKYISMLRDPADSSKGYVEYEMDFVPGGEPKSVGQPNESNVQQFIGRFYIRGFKFEDTAGFRDYVVGRTHPANTITTNMENLA